MNQTSSPAAQLKPYQRQKIAARVLRKQETISGLAESKGVSRKFLLHSGTTFSRENSLVQVILTYYSSF
ncbi:MAG: hypothetical protein N5P05_002658 [Chroococcopsis gigantea SAG 12.99]|jgi:hypothetical protein|nr:hypothetical protein [Chlorogloea purpurea SAG 13.99]MDV3001052.1 hypothetical protein [Chroococcopsis gigantea SAG 12.99]